MARVSGDVPIGADAAKLNAAIAAAQAKIATLTSKTSDLQLDANTTALTAKIAALQAQSAKLAASMGTMTADVDIRAASTKILALDAQVTVLKDAATKIRLDADISAMTAKLALAQAEVKTVGDTATTGGTRAFGPWFNLWSLIGRKVNLFGGAFGTTAIIGTIGAIHLLVQGILEVGAVVIPAAVALGAFGIAAASTVSDIVKSEQAMLTVTTALGGSFPGLTSGLQHFTDSVKPQVYILFGEALNTINAHAGLFQQLATGAGRVLDSLGARAENALGGNGLNGLVSKGVSDLQLLGDIIANVFGIFGNVLKVLPGYAQLLFTALRDVTGALEAITGSSAVQGLLSVGLAMHGAILYSGLLVTALLLLRGPIVALGSLFVTAGLALAAYVESVIVAEGATATFAAILAPLALVNPFVWVAAGIGLLVGLAIWLGNVKTAARQAYDAIISQVNASTTFTSANTALAQGLQQTNEQLKSTPKYITVTTVGMHGQMSTIRELNSQYTGLTDNQKNLSATQVTLNSRMAELTKITGSQSSALADLNSIGVKAGAVATESDAAFKSQVTQIQALVTAETQLAGFTGGPALAAQNALTNVFLNEQLPAIQKVVQAEGNLLSVITGGQVAFNNFQQSIQGTTAKFVSPSGLADAATLAKGNLSGLNQQSLAFSNTLYNQSIPAAQKLIGSLQEQNISQKNLTTVVATAAGQMTAYTGKNTEANSVIVSLINNALGPGTVSLKTLKTWVDNNSTSMTGFSSIIAASTIKAGTLANVLQTQLTAQFQADLLASSGATAQMKLWTDAITNGTSQTSAGKATRDTLIADLEKTGMSATAAKTLVDNMQKSIDAMKGKTVPVGVTIGGQGSITASAQGLASRVFKLTNLATGGRVGTGTGTRDDYPAMLTRGEVVVPVGMVKGGAVDHLKGKLPGFDSGGLVGAAPWTGLQAGGFAADAGGTDVEAMIAAMIAQYKAAAAAAATKAAAAFTGSGGASGGIIQSMMQQMAAARGWTGAEWSALAAVENREAGWSMTAQNPTSGAYGLAQFINGPSEYAQYGGNSTTAQGQITGMLNYIAQRYGDPIAAWNHEASFGWYNQGGMIPGFASGGLAGSLAAGQGTERNAFSSVRSAVASALSHPSAFVKANKASITSELGTLTKRQAAEQTAYARLAGKGLTSGNLSKLDTTLREELLTDQDKRIGTAVPGPVASLAGALNALKAVATAGAPAVAAAAKAAGATTTAAKAGASQPAAGATTMARLGQQEQAEQGDFGALSSAITSALANPSAWLKTNKTSVTNELGTITKRQQAEVAAYAALAGKGLTAANLSKFGTAARAEILTTADKGLSTAAGGPDKTLAAALAVLSNSAKAGVIPSVPVATAVKAAASHAAATTSEGSVPTSVLSESQYTADLSAVHGLSMADIRGNAHLTHLWHLLHLQHLADIGLSQGGKVGGLAMVPRLVHDAGGWIPPGVSMSVNRTGQYEQVTPPGGGGTRKLSADAQAIVDALRENTAAVQGTPHAFAGALNSTSTAAAYRGSYSARR